jgi:Ca-activated chloride channel family protein
MEPLKIGAAKPVFTGTPKDIRSPNLEAPGARENKPADYPVVSYERAIETRREADSKLKKSGKGNLVMSETAVSAGTLIRGKRESKHAEKKQKEEEVSNKELTLTGSSTFNALVKSDTGELKLTGANTFSGGTTVLDGTPAMSDYKLGIRDELKKAKEDKTVDRSDDSYAEPTKEQSRLGGDKKGQNAQLQQKLEEREEAADIRKKPAPPRESLPFNAFVVAVAEPFSTFAMDVDTASYTLTRQALRAGKLPEPERVRLEEIVNAFDYDDTAPDRATFRVYQDGAQSPFGAGYNLLRMGVKGRRIGREEQRPAMLTFVIDVSGSMSQPDRIGFARLALSSLLDQVSANDRIQIIAYSDQAQFVLEPTVATDKARVMAAFNRLQCNGSTNLEEGLRRAYEQAAKAFIPGAENRVILISDGVANLGADSAQEILDKVAANRKQGITCSVFGVGSGTYNDKMLEELANKGDGAYSFLDSAEAVKTAFVDDLSATLNTIAKDAKIQVEWNPKAVRQYRQMGYENRKLTKEQFRDDTVDAGEVGSGQSVTALYELELMPDVTPETLLGTVRIRYQRTDNGKVEEIESALVATTVLRPAHQATVPFRVAASAAEFAELLRGSPHAQNGRFETVADYLRPAALERSLDTRVKELLELVTTAASLSK